MMIGQPRFRPPTRFVVRHAHVVVEGLVGVAAVHSVQRADRHARRVDRHDEQRDALVLGQIGIGAHGEPDVRGDVGERGPDLLAVDHPLVADAHRARAQRREVGAGVRLAVADRERVFAAPDARQVAALLLLAAEVQDRRPDRGVGEVAVGHAPVLHLLDEQELVEQVAPLPALLDGPAHARPAALVERVAEARELGPVGAVGRAYSASSSGVRHSRMNARSSSRNARCSGSHSKSMRRSPRRPRDRAW